MPSKKPPLGITPRFILDERRALEILRAIDRYEKANMKIPHDWIKEYKEIKERER